MKYDLDKDRHIDIVSTGLFQFAYALKPEIKTWLDENDIKVKPIYHKDYFGLRFYNEEHAVLFALTWP